MNLVEAGEKAERQMAFYLNRHFGESKRFIVLNNIRLERKGEVAQIDHMVIHRFGIAIVESKSVSAAVRVNIHGEWERLYNREWRGMPSPVAQARRQGELLHWLLDDHAKEILGNLVFNIPQGVGATALDVFVAISDSGRIIRQKPNLAPEAAKADLIPDRIRKCIDDYARPTQLLNLKAPRTFTESERRALAGFIRAKSSPRRQAADPAPVADAFEQSTPALLRCPACSQARVIDWNRKAGYHFSCSSCNDTEVIKAFCPRCNRPARISKRGNDYSVHCAPCDIRVHYCTVPAAA